MKDAVVLLGYHVGDPCLPCVEVIADLLHVERLVTLGHHGLAFPCAGKGIIGTSGKDRPGVHVVFHVVGLELHVLVADLHVPPIEHPSPSLGEYLPG